MRTAATPARRAAHLMGWLGVLTYVVSEPARAIFLARIRDPPSARSQRPVQLAGPGIGAAQLPRYAGSETAPSCSSMPRMSSPNHASLILPSWTV
jgi:hypothetical protein